ncbi:hypothetical protein [Runella salmonicolor]|uniref:BppU N-terminal domain-containing protein n=1 Tax=Runella salmonicolor TaxID=2950278 RepID=A0ABT1FSU6_9BACT|nr:hypothetical protein [Runella salmonicolor]MCP1384791.1 hypothetical protein [Runella salmonicolor]
MALLAKFSTEDNTIIRIDDNNYYFEFSNTMTLGKAGEGTWEAEVHTTLLGAQKSLEYEYRVIPATAKISGSSPVFGSNYRHIINLFFVEETPTVSEFAGNFIRLTAAIEAEAARDAAEGFAQSAANDAEATAADRIATGEDRVATGEDVVATGLDRIATAADCIATGLDRIATGEDRVATGLDRIATGEDRVATGEDRVATGLDREATAADREATGLDVVAANAAKDIAVAAAGNILTLVSFTDATITMGIGGSVQIEEGPSVYPSLNITFL